MPSDVSVAPPDGLQPIDLSLNRNGNAHNRSANHHEDNEPLNLCVSHQRRHVGCQRSQRRKRRRLERMVNHLHKCSSNSAPTTTSATPSSGDDEERDDDDEDEDEECEKGETASVRNPLLARTLGLLAVPTWPSGGAAAAYRSFYSSGSQQEPTSTAPLPVTVGVAQAQKLSSSSCSPSSSPSPPLMSQCQSGPSMALMQATGRKRTQRALTGKHVKQGTGASPATLLTLRHKIEQRQRGQLCHRAINFHDNSAISRSIAAKKNGSNQSTTRKKKSI